MVVSYGDPMLIAAVLCLCAATVSAVMGVRALARPAGGDVAARVLRAVAPTQLAAAVMLTAGGVVALSDRPSIGLVVLCVAGAIGTVAVGIWQGARYTVRQSDATCSRSAENPCATCTLSCR
jgi:hypothetical protein